MAKNRTNRNDWIVLHMEKIRHLIPDNVTNMEEFEEYIIEALESYREYLQQKREEPEER